MPGEWQNLLPMCLFVVRMFHEAPTFKPTLVGGSFDAMHGRVAKRTAPRNVADLSRRFMAGAGL